MLALRPDVCYYTVLIQIGQTNVIHKIIHGTVEYLRQSQKRVDAIESAVHQSKVNKQAGWFDGLIQALATTWLTLTCPMIVTKCIANTWRRWCKQFHVKREIIEHSWISPSARHPSSLYKRVSAEKMRNKGTGGCYLLSIIFAGHCFHRWLFF